MITIKVIELVRSKPGISEELMDVPVGNYLAETIAEHLKKNVSKKRCEKHPDKESVLLIKAMPVGQLPVVDKTGFCCQEFADLIDVRIELPSTNS
ncbi:MAG: hypothetical protein WDO14_20880 [Bacteroidota bacterium]